MIRIVDTIEQGSDEWFSLRCGSCGSSSVKQAIACGQGKSLKTLAYNLISEKITGEKISIPQTYDMQRGIEMEPEAIEYHSFVTGMEWESVGLITNSDYQGQHTSPDSINRELKAGLEVKCPKANTFVRYLEENRMPIEYVAQIQHAMMITGWKHWHFIAYHPSFERQLILIVERDEKYIAEMESKLSAFFREMKVVEDKIKCQS